MKKLIITMEIYIADKYVDLYIEKIDTLIAEKIKDKDFGRIKKVVNDESNIIMVNLGEI